MHSTLSVRDIQEPRIHTYINAPSQMHLADPDSKMLKERTWEGKLAKKVTTPFNREEKEIIMTVKEIHGCIHESMGKGVDGAKAAQHMIRQNHNRCRVQIRTQPSPTGKPKTRSVTRKENQHRQQCCRQRWGRDKG